ncbi:MAG: 1,4-alpha-glucan branching protein [Ferruginibacter sp.]|nr:1,4-alpha-glucan branching protein [Ferruginibacter sp.]
MKSSSLFSTPAFLNGSNMYEVNIRQYTVEGTFKAFAEHLPRLKDMGVQILWMMPIHPIGIVKRKGILGSYYSIQNHKGINTEFGTEQDFKDLVLKVHALGMKIIIDWVANHTSWDNVWTKTNPEFFVKNEEGDFIAPYDWDDVIQIDHSNEAEQTAMIDAMQYWITHFDIDGFRADLAHLTPLPFWLKARTNLSPFKKDLIWLAETEEVNYHEAFDISYTWKWMHATEQFVKGEKTLADCVKVLTEYKNDFPENALRLFFTSNHDENSWNGSEYEKYGELTKAFAVLSCLYAAVPLVYSGQELPSKKRLLFFEKDLMEWNPTIELHSFYKTLLSFRNENDIFKNAGMNSVIIDEPLVNKNIMAYKIENNNRQVQVFLNLNKVSISENISFAGAEGNYKNIFTQQEIQVGNYFLFETEPGGYCVLEKV